MTSRTPPAIVPQVEVLKRLKREPGATADVDALLIDRYAEANAAATAAEKAKEEAKAALIHALGTAEATACGRVSYKLQTQTRIDTDRLKTAHPDIVAEYCRNVSFRTLRTHKPSPRPVQRRTPNERR